LPRGRRRTEHPVPAGIARIAGQRRDHRAQVGLRGQAAHRVEGAVDRVDAGIDRREHRGRRRTAGVVRVEVHRQPGLLLERAHQRSDGARARQSGHVLDAQHMHASLLQLARDADVVLEVVLAARVEEVGGVADRALAQRAGLDHRVDRHAHVLDPVQRVEYPEDVDAVLGRLAHEEAHHVVRVVGVADRVRSAQQHLQHGVRHRAAQTRQARPGIFLEEAHRDVEGGAAPALHREQPRQQPRVVRRHAQHVDAAHAGREQRLVRIAHRGVGEQHPLLVQHPARELLRAQLLEEGAGAGRRGRGEVGLRQDQVRMREVGLQRPFMSG
jgi:hypothetical protein